MFRLFLDPDYLIRDNKKKKNNTFRPYLCSLAERNSKERQEQSLSFSHPSPFHSSPAPSRQQRVEIKYLIKYYHNDLPPPHSPACFYPVASSSHSAFNRSPLCFPSSVYTLRSAQTFRSRLFCSRRLGKPFPLGPTVVGWYPLLERRPLLGVAWTGLRL